MTVYHVRNWHRYQREFIKGAIRKRRQRAIKRYLEMGEIPDRLDEPHPMTYIRLDVNLDPEIDALADLGMGNRAEGILVRLLRHVARTDALKGCVRVSCVAHGRAMRGTWAQILGCTPRFAEVCAHALIQQRIIVEGEPTLPKWLKELTRVDTIAQEAEKRANRPGTRPGTRPTPRAGTRSGLRARATGEELSPYPSRDGGAPREVGDAPAAGAPRRAPTHGSRTIRTGRRLGAGDTPYQEPTSTYSEDGHLVEVGCDPLDPAGEWAYGQRIHDATRDELLHLPTGAPYREVTPGKPRSNLRIRGHEPEHLEIPPVPPDVDETYRRAAEKRRSRNPGDAA